MKFFRVMYRFGYTSSFFDSSFRTRLSPYLPFSMSMIVISDTMSAILWAQRSTTSFRDNGLNPIGARMSCASFAFMRTAVRVLPVGLSRALANDFTLSKMCIAYPSQNQLSSLFFASCIMMCCLQAITPASNRSMRCVGSTFSYRIRSSGSSTAFTFPMQYSNALLWT